MYASHHEVPSSRDYIPRRREESRSPVVTGLYPAKAGGGTKPRRHGIISREGGRGYGSSPQSFQNGFTLVEVLIAMVIALILLAGVVGLFISQQKSADMILDKTNRLSDLFLASQIMQTELRDAQAICWDDTNKAIVYQPQDSTAIVSDPCPSTGVNSANGFFRYNAATASTTASICWNRPNKATCQELIRDLKDATGIPPGMQISPTSNSDLKALRTITLTALAQNLDRVDRDVPLEFDIWPRN